MAQLVECRLPNGKDVACLCPETTKLVYREVFDSPMYFRHGIALEPGHRVFDVGANIGLFALMLDTVAPDLEIYAFEPIPDIFAALSRNIERHGQGRVRLFNFGLAREAGTAEFTFFPRSTSISSMRPGGSGVTERESLDLILAEMRKHPNPFLRVLLSVTPTVFRRMIAERVRRYYNVSERVTCQLRTLSQILDEEQIDRIDLLKVDTEGAEHDVMDGIRPEHWGRIRQVVVEVHDGPQGFARMRERLEGHGFSVVEEPDASYSQLAILYATRRDLARSSS
jgi:31-O-methyltransferase